MCILYIILYSYGDKSHNDVKPKYNCAYTIIQHNKSNTKRKYCTTNMILWWTSLHEFGSASKTHCLWTQLTWNEKPDMNMIQRHGRLLWVTSHSMWFEVTQNGSVRLTFFVELLACTSGEAPLVRKDTHPGLVNRTTSSPSSVPNTWWHGPVPSFYRHLAAINLKSWSVFFMKQSISLIKTVAMFSVFYCKYKNVFIRFVRFYPLRG